MTVERRLREEDARGAHASEADKSGGCEPCLFCFESGRVDGTHPRLLPKAAPQTSRRARQRAHPPPVFADDWDASQHTAKGPWPMTTDAVEASSEAPSALPSLAPQQPRQRLSFAEEVKALRGTQAAQKRREATETGALLPDDADEDIVIDPLVETHTAQHQHPAARGISQDLVDLVTDAFKRAREEEVGRRRRALYELTHPNPSDYTYGGKLVPPPPLHFGRVTEEAIRLGEELMLRQQYSLVNRAGVRADKGPSDGERPLPDSMVEIGVNGNGSGTTRRQRAAAAVAAPYRSRKREDNIFRDHNYFFEINELYQEVVLVGRANAGKSSLINALLGQPTLAKTSSAPHTTRKINFYQSVSPEELQEFHKRQHHNQLVKLPGGGLQLTFVDMPGYGIEGMSDAWRDAAVELMDAYFGVRRSVNTVLFCIDCERGLTKTDVKYFKWLENVQGVFFVVLTKCDSVPHSRRCSVMRQVYAHITKNRRQCRKVFPYIVPVSSKDGTNLDVLRGLLTETSGMIPGDKLRDLLKQKKAAAMEECLALEALRLSRVREEEREKAKAQFLADYKAKLPADSPLLLLRPRVQSGGPGPNDAVSPPEQTPRPRGPERVFELDLANGRLRAPRRETEKEEGEEEGEGTVNGREGLGEAEAAEVERRRRRARFLAWRNVNPLERADTPYGALRYRLNTGLDNPLTDSLLLEYERPSAWGDSTSADREAPAAHAAADAGEGVVAAASGQPPQRGPPGPPFPESTSRVIGLCPADGGPPTAPSPSSAPASPTSTAAPTGRVSSFLDTLERFGRQSRPEKAEKLRRWRQKGAIAPRLLAEDDSGRLTASQGGRRVGPALVAADTPLAVRQAAWRAQQLKEILCEERAEAPWEAIQSLSRKLEQEKQRALMSGMSRKDRAAYARDAGKVTACFQKFEGEVTAAKYMNEVRQAKTLRSQQQMHLNATAKISYRSMPVGLWKRYGQQDTYWPTPRVLGRENDEGHEPMSLSSPEAQQSPCEAKRWRQQQQQQQRPQRQQRWRRAPHRRTPVSANEGASH